MANTTKPHVDLSQDDMTPRYPSPPVGDAEQQGAKPQSPTTVVPAALVRTPLWKIHELPAPIRTYPLPTFFPNNPLSLVHLVYTWISQAVFPPAREPSIVYNGVWSAKTRSVHITDAKSIRALWEQGFYGKGIFSRSEPNWLKKQQARREPLVVAEAFTSQRRADRKQMKWDRARKEQDAIQRVKFEEYRIAPVGPRELLALPNSDHELSRLISILGIKNGTANSTFTKGVGHVDGNSVMTAKNPGLLDGILELDTVASVNSSLPVDESTSAFPQLNGHDERPRTPLDKCSSPLPNKTSPLKRRKSVRFSAKVDSTTFKYSDPPSPKHCAQMNGNRRLLDGILVNGMNGISPLIQEPGVLSMDSPSEVAESIEVSNDIEASSTTDIVDKEHLQLTLEEAFFLAFGLGALSVNDEATGSTIPVDDLFRICRQYSYSPPRKTGLEPDDPFLVQYAVYHHYRSLGWVPRSGIKFGVDWLLYHRGPAFSHSEFAIVVLPSYSNPYWKEQGRIARQPSWQHFFTVNRIQAQNQKTVVMVYVDIPPPVNGDIDIPSMLKRYKIREVMVRRWSLNRNRN